MNSRDRTICSAISSAINDGGHGVCTSFCAYVLFAVVVTAVNAHLLSARGVIVNFAFAAVAPCVAIVVGRRVLGRKNL